MSHHRGDRAVITVLSAASPRYESAREWNEMAESDASVPRNIKDRVGLQYTHDGSEWTP